MKHKNVIISFDEYGNESHVLIYSFPNKKQAYKFWKKAVRIFYDPGNWWRGWYTYKLIHPIVVHYDGSEKMKKELDEAFEKIAKPAIETNIIY